MVDDTAPPNVYLFRVRSHQTDLNAAMYHGAFFDVFDDARIDTFRRMGYTYERMLAGEWGVVIRSVHCEFSLPAFMDQLLSITVTVPRLSRATLTLQYECRRGNERIALGQIVYVFVGADRRPRSFPADLREVVQNYIAVSRGADAPAGVSGEIDQ